MDHPAPTRTVQLTSKRLKAHVAVSAVVTLLGLLLLGGGMSSAQNGGEPNAALTAFGGLLLVAGVFWLVVTKVRIWWHHG